MINQPRNSATETNPEKGDGSPLLDALIWRPVMRWYIRPLEARQSSDKLHRDLTPAEWQSVRRQAVIGWLQTVLLVVVFIQVIFAGMLRALPPDVRTTLSFLHRIEWGAYLGIILIVSQVAIGWSGGIVLTN